MANSDIPVTGSEPERRLFTECYRHYLMARQDLEQRITDFDKKDILFRSHIPEANWPYQAMVFVPQTFTALTEKDARLFANKPKGRLVPREGGDSLGAKINNELLSYQWDDAERAEGLTMLSRWGLMSLNARKYGASFGLCKWKYERKTDADTGKLYPYFDGPNFTPLNNRDCLPNPSYSTIKNWFQYREYLTLNELQSVNDAARSKPIYKNLDILRMKLREESRSGGDQRDTNYVIKNKQLKGLQDYLGHDEVYKTVEVITEYRCDKWITFSPKHGVILRDIPNPYKHGQIPVVMLKYYPVDDDLYGLSEIEPIEKLQRALNAYLCQNLDTLNMSTYSPLKVNSTGGAVQMHTLEFGPGKRWLMRDPHNDVVPFELNPQGVSELVPVFRLISGAINEALGETSANVSNADPGAGDKTATEIRDLAVSRSARDNYNQLFLADALKKQMMFWFTMNQQFLFSNPQEQQKIIRIVGKDAIKYFQNMGLDGEALNDDSIEALSGENVPPDLNINEFMSPMYPVTAGGVTVPKLTMEEDGQTGTLIISPEDLMGNYDYIPDVDSMRIPDEQQMLSAAKNLVEITLNPATSQLLMQEGYKIKAKDVLEDFYEKLGIKDADKYFEKLQPQLPVTDPNGQQIDPQTGQPIPQRAGDPQAGASSFGNGQLGGVAGGSLPVPNGAAQPIVS